MKRTTPARNTLSARALNRALLARQMLLERAEMTPHQAVEHLLGMQAQVPTDPYFGLWSRLAGFDPNALSELIVKRKAVRTAVMRGTLHLLSARDALMLRPWVQPVLTRTLLATAFGKNTRGVDMDALIAIGRAVVEKTPLTLAELRPILGAAFPGYDETALSWAFHYLTPLVQVPPRALWGEGGLPRVTTVETWLRRPLREPEPEQLVLRYLAAFGPASIADMQAWAGLTKLGAFFEALRPKLVTFRDETGRELFDLPHAPRPDPDTRAPPRFLPVYDNVVLGLANRDRILAGTPPRAVPQNLNVRAFLIDGFVAGFWKIDEAKDAATLTLEPFGTLKPKDRRALAEEGHDLLAFAAPEAKHAVRFATVY